METLKRLTGGGFTVQCGGCNSGRVGVRKKDTRIVNGQRVAMVTRALCGSCCRRGLKLQG